VTQSDLGLLGLWLLTHRAALQAWPRRGWLERRSGLAPYPATVDAWRGDWFTTPTTFDHHAVGERGAHGASSPGAAPRRRHLAQSRWLGKWRFRASQWGLRRHVFTDLGAVLSTLCGAGVLALGRAAPLNGFPWPSPTAHFSAGW